MGYLERAPGDASSSRRIAAYLTDRADQGAARVNAARGHAQRSDHGAEALASALLSAVSPSAAATNAYGRFAGRLPRTTWYWAPTVERESETAWGRIRKRASFRSAHRGAAGLAAGTARQRGDSGKYSRSSGAELGAGCYLPISAADPIQGRAVHRRRSADAGSTGRVKG